MEYRQTSRKEDALSAIRELIFSREFVQGALFSENQLVEKLGVSRTPIREALTSLERQGLVEKIPQVGVRVREFTERDLQEIFAAREALEPYCAEVLAKSASDEDIEVLEALVEAMERAADKDEPSLFLAPDVEFHWRIAERAGLPLFRELLSQIGDRIRIIGFISTPTKPWMKKAIREHEEILNSVRKNDPAAAAAACLRHLAQTKDRIETGKHQPIFD